MFTIRVYDPHRGNRLVFKFSGPSAKACNAEVERLGYEERHYLILH